MSKINNFNISVSEKDYKEKEEACYLTNNQIKEFILELAKIEDKKHMIKDDLDIIEGIGAFINDNDTLGCDTTNGNSDDYNTLRYKFQKCLLKFEVSKLEDKLSSIENLIKKTEEQYNKLKSSSENLVYTILSFIASFSIITAAISAIDKIEGMLNILFFIVFIIFILAITLIFINNFYKTKTKSNYVIAIIIGLVLICLIAAIIVYDIQDKQYLENSEKLDNDTLVVEKEILN